jgi:hypothetical protein
MLDISRQPTNNTLMHFRPNISYPDSENQKIDSLEKLFRDWHQHFAANSLLLGKHAADEMVWDGFYPHYTSQKKRILFVGRESRDITGCHNTNVLFEAYRSKDKSIGGQHLDNNNFHSRMIYIAYGIMNGMPLWQDIPYASEIVDTFGEAGGLSFAFMNISKLSNESEHFASDFDAINASYAVSTQGRNFIQEEVAILKPHIVITMNLEDKIHALGQLTELHRSGETEAYRLICGDQHSLLINTWHFAAWNKNAIKCFYNPICDAIRRFEAA